jgi:putative oxidoreductase
MLAARLTASPGDGAATTKVFEMATRNVLSTRSLDMPTSLRIGSRVAQSVVFLMGGSAVWANPAGPSRAAAGFLSNVREHCPPLSGVSDEQFVRANAAVMVTGGLALGSGLAPRFGATLLLGSLVPTTVAAFPYWTMPTGPERMHAQSDFLKNLAVAGGLVATLAYSLRTGRRL